MPEGQESPSVSITINNSSKRKKIIIIFPIILMLIILYILAWSPWVTENFANQRAISSLDPYCRELKAEEYYPSIGTLYSKVPTLKEILGLEPFFGSNTILYVLCEGKGLRNTYFVSFYGATKLESSESVILTMELKKDETADWKIYQNEK